MHWPRVPLAERGATTVVFTASSSNQALSTILSDDFNFELCLRKLSLEQQLKVRNAKHDPAKALALVLFSKVVLNYALYCAGATDSYKPFADVPMVSGENGKPALALPSGPVVEFNSSSSNDLMAIVVQYNGTTPVGIDLSHETQQISETHFVEQFEGIFAESELAQLAAVAHVAERYVFFNQLWTLKEAFTKFVGCGLNVDLASFFFDVGRRPKLEDPRVVDEKHYKKLAVEWQRGISVNYEGLDRRFKDQIADSPVYCQCGVLRKGSALPVFVSLVGQTAMEDVEVVSIDMGEIVRSIVGE